MKRRGADRYPRPFNRVQQALLGHFEADPAAVFCRQVGSEGETTITWRDLEGGCGGFQEAYRRAGVEPGGQVLIFLRHTPHLYGAFFGAMLGGLTPAFMPCSSPRQDPGLYWRSHDELLRRIEPAAIVADAATVDEMRAAGLSLAATPLVLAETVTPGPLQVRFAPEESVGLLQHSSGTTGLKKGVALSYAAIADQIESYARAIDLSPADVIVSWLPLYHDMGLIACLVMPACFGVQITHIDPLYWVSRPGVLLDAIVAHRGALTWLPNFAFDHLAGTVSRRAAEWDLSGMRAFINCSEPCKSASLDRFAGAFAASGVRREQLQCCYAMAETVFAVSQTALGAGPPARIHVEPASLARGARPRSARPGEGVELVETGTVVQGLTVSIHDENGEAIADDAVGEIGIRGRFLFSGYNRDPGRTAERLRGDLYLTGDLGFLRDGRLYVLGRLDDLLIVNGRNLYAHEIEAAVTALPGLKRGRTVALGWFDPRFGSECLVLMAERERGTPRSDDDLRRDITRVVQSTFAVVPRAIELVDEGRLIKTTSGKISRTENLARFLEARACSAQ
jgi:acyl-CoA synthetase (AMP-forming)/AMP-acid ligase II